MRNEESFVTKNKEMDCCSTIDVDETTPPVLAQVVTNGAMTRPESCVRCKAKGRAVSRKTVLLMLKPDLLEHATTGSYSFCAEPDCPVVYFDEAGDRHFTVEDLRVRVGPKAKDDPIPLCYCFGFDESHIREEIAQSGRTSIPERISKLIREGLCACDTCNPAGACCLGEVNKAVKRLTGK